MERENVIKSIWQNKGIYTTTAVVFTELCIIRIWYSERVQYMFRILWSLLVLVSCIVIIIAIRRAIKYKNADNFIYTNAQYILVPFEECDVLKERDKYTLRYIISHKRKIEDIPYRMSDVFEIDIKKEKEFDKVLRYQEYIKFVYSEKNPCFNKICKNEELGKNDNIEKRAGWRRDCVALLFFIADIVFIVYGTLSTLPFQRMV